MTATRSTAGDGSAQEPTLALGRPEDEAGQGGSLLASALGDRCGNCGSGLAADQRYCVDCGERRGKPRFALTGTHAPRDVMPVVPRRRRVLAMTTGTTLIAGVATLLLALGVGVLIGHNNSAPLKASTPQVITVNGGSAAGSSSTGNTGATTGAASSHSTGTKASSKLSKTASKATTATSKKTVSTKAATKATQAASSTLKPKSGVNLAPSTQKQGATCTAGTAGCQNGKFSGNFFGG
jgi:hypothetical protein